EVAARAAGRVDHGPRRDLRQEAETGRVSVVRASQALQVDGLPDEQPEPAGLVSLEPSGPDPVVQGEGDPAVTGSNEHPRDAPWCVAVEQLLRVLARDVGDIDDDWCAAGRRSEPSGMSCRRGRGV